MNNRLKNSPSDRLNALSDLAELERVRNFVTDKALHYGFRENEAQSIALAVDEAFTNLIKHSYKYDTSKHISVQIETDKNNFFVNIYDEGNSFNPLDYKTTAVKENLEKYQRGGLGIFLMKSVMDEIAYFPSTEKNPQNCLRLKKSLLTEA